MNEELNEINTDLKELFVANQLEEMTEVLNKLSDEEVNELAISNHNIIKKYYDSGNQTLLFQYIKFVAFACYLVEYAYGRQLTTEEEQKDRIFIYEEIYGWIRSANDVQ
ncbi:MAG: hypothetical protein K0S47_1472 [Herbinix sp.]|jgi:hypothetical protein|nr:hypothetical protein [Herbinix sp.]